MNPAHTIDALTWPQNRLAEGMEELARRAHLQRAIQPQAIPPHTLSDDCGPDLERWMSWAAHRLGIEAQSIGTSLVDIESIVQSAAPALFQITRHDKPVFLLLLGTQRGTAQLLGPDLHPHTLATADLIATLCETAQAPSRNEIERLLTLADVPRARWDRVRPAMLKAQLAHLSLEPCWILRTRPSGDFWGQVIQIRLPHRVGFMLGLFALVYGLEIASWSLMGQTTLDGRINPGWIYAWTLLVLSLIPLRLLGAWLDATLSLDFARLLKSRLLAGALRMDIEFVRRQGVGQLLGQVIESKALESLALNGGMGLLVALLELVFAASILATGAGGVIQLYLLLAWLVLTLGLSWRYFHALRQWTRMRLQLTQDLVERMVGHKTRLAQEPPGRRVAQDDQAMVDYLQTSKAMDTAILPALAVMPRGWMIVGLLGLAPAFIEGTGSAVGLAIGLGGMLLANRALSGISGGLSALSSAAVSWAQVGTLFKAATEQASNEPFQTTVQIEGQVHHQGEAVAEPARVLVDAHQLDFSYPQSSEKVLNGLDLQIKHGERILLVGTSGGGKSTLARLLVGLHTPDAGLLLLNGLDRHTLGETWHQFATEAPQFHDNHILSGTLGFNLLMGRQWPASAQDLQEAADMCEELGLGELLRRMPSGMTQMVGETGWQLSHGERSRIFLARALLQNAQLTILDESFAALDPQTLEKCLTCVLARARTLMVIAHP